MWNLTPVETKSPRQDIRCQWVKGLGFVETLGFGEGLGWKLLANYCSKLRLRVIQVPVQRKFHPFPDFSNCLYI